MCLLSMPCPSNIICLLYLYPFLVLVCQTIEYFVMFFTFRFPRALHVNTFLRPSIFLFSPHILYILSFEFVYRYILLI